MKCFLLVFPLLIAASGLAATKATFQDLLGTAAVTNAATTNLLSTNAVAARPQTNATLATTATDLDALVQAAAAYESGQSLEPLRRLEEKVQQSIQTGIRGDIESALIKLLQTNSTFEARKFAAKQLGIIGSSAALPALNGLLKDDDTAGLACLALTAYPAGKADDLLRSALEFAGPKAVVQIINTLGDRKDARSVPVLEHYTKNADLSTAEAAVAALGKIGTPAAFKAIHGLSVGGNPELTHTVTEALLRYAEDRLAARDLRSALRLYEQLLKTSDVLAVRRTALSVLLQHDKDEGEERIMDVLSGKDDALKPVAIHRIASVTAPGASEKFATQMHHLSLENQALLLDALASRGDDAARLELAKSLSSPDPIVRRAGIAALGRIGDPYFVSLLARAANSGDAEEAKAIEAALVGLKGGAETDKRMNAELKNALPKARVPLIAAVARRQGAAANSVLLEEVNSSDPPVAKAALRALARTGGPAEAAALIGKVGSLHDAGVRTEAQSTATQLLSKIPDPAKRFAAVKEALDKATTVDSRIALLELLPACGNSSALTALTTAAHDSETQVRDPALRALADWPDQAAWEPLLQIYRQPESENCSTIALRGLVRLLGDASQQADPQVIPQYRELFSSARRDSDLKLVLSSIATVPDPDALSLVIPFLSRPGTSREASAAARTIVETIKAKRPDLTEEAEKRLQQKVPQDATLN